jgi:hypothetical protein
MAKPTLAVWEARHRLAPSEGQKENKIKEGMVEKMRKMMKAVLVLIAILTVAYVGVVVYANTNSSHPVNSSDYRDPIDYGIWRHYLAEKLQWEPQEWNTTEELGIILVPSKVTEDHYHIFIVDEEKALPWMNGTTSEPYAVKYRGSFYRIMFLWVTPGLPENIKQWQLPIGVALGAGWICTGAVFFKESEKK